ncbi:MAG: hypothetical protein ACE5HT_07235 [Gemmatimonadales bacterium]
MLRHCTLQELLDVRNGEGSLGARTHVDECAECRDELDMLHQRVAALKALPSLNAPRDRWQIVSQTVRLERRRSAWLKTGWVAAAALALLVGVNAFAHRTATTSNLATELQMLVRQSQQLDSALESVHLDGRVVNGMTALAIADLEDRITMIDTRLSAAQRVAIPPDELTGLFRQRVYLMDALVTTQVRRAAYVGF